MEAAAPMAAARMTAAKLQTCGRPVGGGSALSLPAMSHTPVEPGRECRGERFSEREDNEERLGVSRMARRGRGKGRFGASSEALAVQMNGERASAYRIGR